MYGVDYEEIKETTLGYTYIYPYDPKLIKDISIDILIRIEDYKSSACLGCQWVVDENSKNQGKPKRK